MPIYTTLKDESTGTFMLRAAFAKKESPNQPMLDALMKDPTPAVMGVKVSTQKKKMFVDVPLTDVYSVMTRLQDPISSSELLLLLKGMIDSYQQVMAYGIPATALIYSLDRVFIRVDGNIAWVTFGVDNQSSDTTLLDLFYMLSGEVKPRSQSDERFLQKYQAIFEQDLPDNQAFLQAIFQFVTSQYDVLEKKIVSEYQAKGHHVEGLVSDDDAKRWQQKEADYQNQIQTLSDENQQLKAELDNLATLQATVNEQAEALKHKDEALAEVKEQIQQVNAKPQARAQRSSQPSVLAQPTEASPAVHQGQAPVQQKPSMGRSLTSELMNSFYDENKQPSTTESTSDDDVFEISGETTILGNLLTLHLVNTQTHEDYQINDGTTYIGKGNQNDVVLKDKAVSGEHAKIAFDAESGETTIVDLESTNGTFVNNNRIQRNVPVTLYEDSTVRLGRLTFTVHFKEED